MRPRNATPYVMHMAFRNPFGVAGTLSRLEKEPTMDHDPIDKQQSATSAPAGSDPGIGGLLVLLLLIPLLVLVPSDRQKDDGK